MLIRMGMGGQLSGSVGGVVASHNKGGAYLRNRSVPTNPRTNRQQLARQALGGAAESWKTLTGAQREQWEGYSSSTPVVNRLGESITLSGFNMYVRAYAFFVSAGEAAQVVSDGPAVPGLVSLGDITVALSQANGVTLTGLSADVNGPGLVSISPALSPGVGSFGGPFTAFLTSAELSAIDGVATVGNQSVNRYGVPLQAQRRAVRVAGANPDGRLSAVFQTIVTVAA